ncbi:4Fe-4S ferredoxin iron-sulfur binding domain-containing protein [Gemmatirosa kalamazoonensis]|uniref:4Fe-4S ferredoxin iron-sulfur binding domain-containing protein n=1 Tax=Gemmatirosa kalamazoonensis TaxID=861299 RepID=W0RHY9_9BACT|nr:FAD-dependent oxidoreductase [Gemmatirosa kalamazoonensis]AHG89028.1 4Fe-4S ferredoxin iron-sulfur binding domain-containing protein [Gemmatirosa kalamazoonensis]
MKPTDVTRPEYYHRVVDCQWACPAHTDVPKYLRLIGQGRYTEAYLVNRESNVFPGILGRTCDRPCEPACRRGRVDGKPVAICRLKRVAADLRDDVRDFLPTAPDVKNGKRVALVGAGPASLTVANDLVPLGYQCTIFEQHDRAGGLMRINIPSFRLPAEVLDEETQSIIDMGVEVRYGTPVTSLTALLDEGWDAVFVGSGAPKGKELELPGRHDAPANVHIGIEWLANVHFGHVDRIGERVLIIGVGNTAMDCCRTARRLGGKDISVIARRSRQYFKASPWELEDAEEEGVHIVENHSPKRFVIDGGRLVGLEFEAPNGTVVLPCDDVILAIGQENAFPWIERDAGVAFADGMPVVDKVTFQSTRPGVFFGGDAAWGPQNIIWAVAHGHQAAISIHNHCRGVSVDERPPEGMTLVSAKVGMHAWAYSNDYNAATRQKMTHADLEERFSRLSMEVELGFTPEQAATEVERCLNCDIETHFTSSTCIECDACVDVCPVSCLSIVPNAEDPATLLASLVAPPVNPTQPLYVSDALPQTARVMVKDEDVCVHCGLCAERCPTAAWDMRTFELQLPYAGRPATDHRALPMYAAPRTLQVAR